MGSPRAPANLPGWSQNDLEQNMFLESNSVNIVDSSFVSVHCLLLLLFFTIRLARFHF